MVSEGMEARLGGCGVGTEVEAIGPVGDAGGDALKHITVVRNYE